MFNGFFGDNLWCGLNLTKEQSVGSRDGESSVCVNDLNWFGLVITYGMG